MLTHNSSEFYLQLPATFGEDILMLFTLLHKKKRPAAVVVHSQCWSFESLLKITRYSCTTWCMVCNTMVDHVVWHVILRMKEYTIIVAAPCTQFCTRMQKNHRTLADSRGTWDQRATEKWQQSPTLKFPRSSTFFLESSDNANQEARVQICLAAAVLRSCLEEHLVLVLHGRLLKSNSRESLGKVLNFKSQVSNLWLHLWISVHCILEVFQLCPYTHQCKTSSSHSKEQGSKFNDKQPHPVLTNSDTEPVYTRNTSHHNIIRTFLWLQSMLRKPKHELPILITGPLPVAPLTFTAISTAQSKYSATFSKSSSIKPLLVNAGVPVVEQTASNKFITD